MQDASGESVGKYNKRPMLPVHRLDNISVALGFLSKKGIIVGFLNPQDVLDGDRGKILRLMGGVVKRFS